MCDQVEACQSALRACTHLKCQNRLVSSALYVQSSTWRLSPAPKTRDMGGNENTTSENRRNDLAPESKLNCKASCLPLGPFQTNDVALLQVATADGRFQRAVSLRGQGGLLLGMDAPLLGSLPA